MSATTSRAGTIAGQLRMPGQGTVLPQIDEIGLRSQPSPRRALATVRAGDVLALLGAALSATGLTWLIFTQLAPFSGQLGMVAIWYLCFVAAYALLVAMAENQQTVTDRLLAAVIHTLAGTLIVALVFVLGYVLARGADALRHTNFYLTDLSTTGPSDPLDQGGVLHAAIGSLEQIAIALVLTIPTGIATAVYLNEFRGPVPRFVRTIVEAMTALPSIVAGLFVFTAWILTLGREKSGLAAALALSIMMLPIIVRAADVVLRLVPGSLREASLAMGAGQWRTIWHVVLPTARSGLATAVILGTARGIGETSPVLLTAGYTTFTNANPLHGPQVSLPLLAFSLFNLPDPTMRSRALGAAAVLLLLVLGLFLTARAVGGRGPGQLSRRQVRRRAVASRADAERFVARAAAAGRLPALAQSAFARDAGFGGISADPKRPLSPTAVLGLIDPDEPDPDEADPDDLKPTDPQADPPEDAP